MPDTKLEIKLPDHSDEESHQIITRNGKDYILFVRIDNDPDGEKPHGEQGTANGHIYTFKRNSVDFNIEAARDAIKNNPDHVKLSYYEHGLCRWSVQGDSVPGEEFEWDGVRLGGVWVPDKDALANIKAQKNKLTHRERVIRYAKGIVETYTQWCNGEVYAYDVELYELQRDDDDSAILEWEHYQRHVRKAKIDEDSCCGFYGWDTVEEAAREAAESMIPAEVTAQP